MEENEWGATLGDRGRGSIGGVLTLGVAKG